MTPGIGKRRRTRVKLSDGSQVIISRGARDGDATTLTLLQRSGVSASARVSTTDLDEIAEALDEETERMIGGAR